MANPTTNYGFVMPTPTDLVTDLPADFGVFGQAVDTQMKTNADAATQKATLTTKGDIYAATGTSTPARLAVGANDTVLTADSTAATGMKWATVAAGGQTLLSTTTLSGASTTISSISQSYKHLLIIMYGVTNDTANGATRIKPNNDSLCDYIGVSNTNSANSNAGFDFTLPNEVLRTSADNVHQCMIYNYSNTSFNKAAAWSSSYLDTGSAKKATIGGGQYRSTSAISSLVFSNYGGDYSTGTVLLYGVS